MRKPTRLELEFTILLFLTGIPIAYWLLQVFFSFMM